MGNRLYPGKYIDTMGNNVLSIGICDRCNRKVAYDELRPDPNFPGLRVCRDDIDVLDPWRLAARQTEVITLRHPRPDQSVATGQNTLLNNGSTILQGGDGLLLTESGEALNLDPNAVLTTGFPTQSGDIET